MHGRISKGGKLWIPVHSTAPLIFLLPRLQKKNIESLGPPLSFRKAACKLQSFCVFTFSFALFFIVWFRISLPSQPGKIRCQSLIWVGEELKENKNLLNTDGVSFSHGVKVKFKTFQRSPFFCQATFSVHFIGSDVLSEIFLNITRNSLWVSDITHYW